MGNALFIGRIPGAGWFRVPGFNEGTRLKRERKLHHGCHPTMHCALQLGGGRLQQISGDDTFLSGNQD